MTEHPPNFLKITAQYNRKQWQYPFADPTFEPINKGYTKQQYENIA